MWKAKTLSNKKHKIVWEDKEGYVLVSITPTEDQVDECRRIVGMNVGITHTAARTIIETYIDMFIKQLEDEDG